METQLTIDQLKKQSDSLIENIAALRFAITRIEDLEKIVWEAADQLEDLNYAEAKKLLREVISVSAIQTT